MAKKATKKELQTADTAPLAAYERTMNLQRWLAGIYGIQAVALLMAAEAYSVTVTTTFLTADTLSATDSYSPAIKGLFDFNIVYLLAGTLFLLAVVQLLAVTVYRDRYLRLLEVRTFVLRSITFAIGVTATVWTIALLSGLQDKSVLVLLAIAVAAATISLYLYEQRAARKATVILGWVSGIGAASVLAAIPLTSWLNNGDFPIYLYGVYAAFAAYIIAVIVLVIRSERRGGSQTARLRAERSLGIALLGLQSLIVWQVFLGVLT